MNKRKAKPRDNRDLSAKAVDALAGTQGLPPGPRLTKAISNQAPPRCGHLQLSVFQRTQVAEGDPLGRVHIAQRRIPPEKIR
jgi:hypothetical protein